MKKFFILMLAMLWMSVAAFSQITISQEDYDKLPGDSKIRHFDNSTCDVVFVVVITGDMYEIPSSEINVKGALTLTSDWDKYKVSL